MSRAVAVVVAALFCMLAASKTEFCLLVVEKYRVMVWWLVIFVKERASGESGYSKMSKNAQYQQNVLIFIDVSNEIRYNIFTGKGGARMTIIKKSGKKEEFSREKLASSIAAACNDANAPLNEQELSELVSEFCQIVSGKALITSAQIDIVINGILYSKGYFGVLQEYVSYNKQK